MKKDEKSLDLGHWTTNLQEFDTLPFGFIYEITNNVTNKKYIGKKQCVTVLKRKPLKGKTKKRHEKVETDWRSYTSSSRELNDDIIKYGKDNFTFEIIRICESKFELAYFEAKLQFEKEVLLNEQYYNGIINLRVSKPKRFQA